MTIYGYARVSTAGQSLNEQIEALKNSGAETILSEKYTGTTTCSEVNKLDYFYSVT